jgi:hypothetical protein
MLAAKRALMEDGAPLRVNPGRDICGGDFACGLPEFGWVLLNRNRVHIDHAEEAFIVMLHGDPVADSAQIIAKVQVSGRLHAGEYPVHWMRVLKLVGGRRSRRGWGVIMLGCGLRQA